MGATDAATVAEDGGALEEEVEVAGVDDTDPIYDPAVVFEVLVDATIGTLAVLPIVNVNGVAVGRTDVIGLTGTAGGGDGDDAAVGG